MDGYYLLALIAFVALTSLMMEGLKELVKSKAISGGEKWNNFYNNKKLKKLAYAFVVLIPCTGFGFILAKIDGRFSIYHVISQTSILYVIQYLCGMSIVEQLKEVVPTWVKKIVK